MFQIKVLSRRSNPVRYLSKSVKPRGHLLGFYAFMNTHTHTHAHAHTHIHTQRESHTHTLGYLDELNFRMDNFKMMILIQTCPFGTWSLCCIFQLSVI